ncbi:MAG: PQQ-binding-like beta-propeller repeat protein [Proteobacteria bacterium]|nr:PQQ-binding-like beta-propeller repeat protein [Pseudomonadota bacterium]
MAAARPAQLSTVALLALAALAAVAGGAVPAAAADVAPPASSVMAPATGAAAEGAALYSTHCAACHDHPVDRIPPKVFISTTRTAEDVIDTLTLGAMRTQAEGLSAVQIQALAVYLTGKQPAPRAAADANLCQKPPAVGPASAGDWRSWGRDPVNSRFHPDSGLTAALIPHLKLRWAFAYPGRAAFGQPAVLGKLVIAGGTAGRVFALDLASGCTYWSYDAGALVRTGILIGQIRDQPGRPRWVAWFGDDRGTLHAVDLRDGKSLWRRSLDPHPMARLLGTPQLHAGILYAPVSSLEEVAAADPKYRCCSFRGSLVALDAATGRKIWQRYTISRPPRPFTTHGRQMLGPAGGSIFGAVTLDAARGRIYLGTGDSYTDAPSDSTDALLALNLADGRRIWTHQVLPGDAWILLCKGAAAGNCPSPLGPDFDFASSPMLMQLAQGRQVLIAGSKSGIVYAFDPLAKGRLLWNRQLAHGSPNGGILWGPANDGVRAYIATSSYDASSGSGPGALTALDPGSGRILWSTPTPGSPCAWGTTNCAHALLAAVTVIPGAVFAGAMDGHIRAYDAADGHVVWQFDTGGDFNAVNGIRGHGGAIDYGGAIVANGVLLVNSGSMRQGGNLLLAFSPQEH